MIFLDTNIFLRFFVQAEGYESEMIKVEKLFVNIIAGRIKCFTNTMVIMEIIWVLEKYYKWKKDEVCDNIELILSTPNIRIKERTILHSAIAIYRKINIDFIDIYNYTYLRAENSLEIYSYDTHFDRLSKMFNDIRRMTP